MEQQLDLAQKGFELGAKPICCLGIKPSHALESVDVSDGDCIVLLIARLRSGRRALFVFFTVMVDTGYYTSHK